MRCHWRIVPSAATQRRNPSIFQRRLQRLTIRIHQRRTPRARAVCCPSRARRGLSTAAHQEHVRPWLHAAGSASSSATQWAPVTLSPPSAAPRHLGDLQSVSTHLCTDASAHAEGHLATNSRHRQHQSQQNCQTQNLSNSAVTVTHHDRTYTTSVTDAVATSTTDAHLRA